MILILKRNKAMAQLKQCSDPLLGLDPLGSHRKRDQACPEDHTHQHRHTHTRRKATEA